MVVGVETLEGFYQAVLCVEDKNQTNLSVVEAECIWHMKIEHYNDEASRASISHIREVEADGLGKAAHCDTCAEENQAKTCVK